MPEQGDIVSIPIPLHVMMQHLTSKKPSTKSAVKFLPGCLYLLSSPAIS